VSRGIPDPFDQGQSFSPLGPLEPWYRPGVPSCWVRRSDGLSISLVGWCRDRYEFGPRDAHGRTGPIHFVLTEAEFLAQMVPT
jgi:hypothetical protein